MEFEDFASEVSAQDCQHQSKEMSSIVAPCSECKQAYERLENIVRSLSVVG